MPDWTKCSDQMPEPTCDINDLLVWCPDNSLGLQLVLAQYDGEAFTAFFDLDDLEDVRRKDLYVTHWQPAPHMGPNHKNQIIWAESND